MPEAAALASLHAVVTGGGRGIGAAIARRLAALGAEVTLMGRDEARLEAAAGALPGARAIACDVTDSAAVRAAFERAGDPQILVNNAGAVTTAPFAKTSEAQFRAMLEVNLAGAFRCTRAVLPAMHAAGFGRIVNLASTAGLKGYAYVSAYCAAKHGLVGLTRALALETARSGITVNAVCPGYTDTDMVRQAVSAITAKTGRSEAEALAALTRDTPQGRLIRPEEVAEAVAWLCRPDSGAITGQVIAVAGGETA